ncbi:phosphomannomutase CpsG [Parashewanella spongiae]|uniref:phosphomannomutase n=1 Tax=Parashewanella spongiae TaxID=342950 RepID=A0A3A6TUW2_9GAMM|nr:phosphomannomutase CpsG [Parashewanella spongiae]MCL1077747.1 phosphomannomutase CpsG [Parashewanella spongiae]RJY18052.1 phosphomannomutase CpsG [Parashewanella spongiae]
MSELSCFKAYDIRGKLGDDLNESIAYDIGRAYAKVIKPKIIVVGGDVRATSETLKIALSDGLREEGVDVLDIGLVGTEEIYFATSNLNLDGGIVVTASHNPIDYNGMKLVREQSRPISGDTGLLEIKTIAENKPWLLEQTRSIQKGSYSKVSNLAPYISHLLSYLNFENIKPLKLVVNAGNGAAGHVIDALEDQFKALNVPIHFIKIHHEADATFPNGIPNPLIPEKRQSTRDAVIKYKADMGIAWDGDFDRCFLFDENGQFIEGYYIVGLLAESFLQKDLSAKIIHDPRLTWNTINIVKTNGGRSVQCKTGHAFIKERMRDEDAVYGGEMSAHHYFRDFSYCDSGMIPWLLVVELLSVNDISLSKAIAARLAAYPSSGEINLSLRSPQDAIKKISALYLPLSTSFDETDGISLEFNEKGKMWRFNLRNSNTEPLVRLNVESKGDKELMKQKTKELMTQLTAL